MELLTTETKITFNCRGRLLILDRPVVMGIINATPDSFYETSRRSSESQLLHTAEVMLRDGATIIDIGGQSTRPGAIMVTEEEEMSRVIPAIQIIASHFPQALISVDTFRAGIAARAVESGAHIINDISAGEMDPRMFETISALKVPYILMHKKGNPDQMQKNPQYEDVVNEVLDYFISRIRTLNAMGCFDLMIDPGFGFGKTLAHNYTLLRALKDFGITGLPVVVGVSRKKMIQQITGTDAGAALNGTSVAHTLALLNGAKVLRAHDVKEAAECIKLVNAYHGIISPE